VEIAALEKGRYGARHDRPPEAVLALKPLVVDLLKGLKIPVHQAPSLKHTYTSCQAGGARHPRNGSGSPGRIRGMKYKRADGQSVRPSLVVIDRTRSRVERVGFAWERGQVRQT
jgi:hypothetical protein